jgi:hypothetical protein
MSTSAAASVCTRAGKGEWFCLPIDHLRQNASSGIISSRQFRGMTRTRIGSDLVSFPKPIPTNTVTTLQTVETVKSGSLSPNGYILHSTLEISPFLTLLPYFACYGVVTNTDQLFTKRVSHG